jgi:branched-chain amino acid transport system permease protein
MRTVRVGLVIALAAALLYAPFYFAPFRVFQLSLLFAYVCALLGLNLLTGHGGQISLGHGAFFALGAYVTAILMERLPAAFTYLVALPVAGLAAFALGFAFGIPALRLRGLYLALGTLALSVVTPPLLRRFEPLTGGSGGIGVTEPQAPAFVPLARDQWIYLVALGVTVLLGWWARNLARGRVGRALAAVRDNEIAAESTGVELARVKTLAFAVASAFAGVGGALYTWVIAFVSPESFGLLLSINLLAGLVVGGLATTAGPVIGAAFLLFVPPLAARINDAVPGVVFGALLIGTVLVAPQGIAGLLARLVPARGEAS